MVKFDPEHFKEFWGEPARAWIFVRFITFKVSEASCIVIRASRFSDVSFVKFLAFLFISRFGRLTYVMC